MPTTAGARLRTNAMQAPIAIWSWASFALIVAAALAMPAIGLCAIIHAARGRE